MRLLILTLFIGIPLIEIYLFIQVGGLIGTWSTIALVILTAFIGTAMLRQQGMATMARAQAEIREDRLPVRELFNGFCLLVGGLMLLTPGFLTDALGFSLLLPPLRAVIGRGIWKLFQRSGNVHFSVYGANPGTANDPNTGPGPVIDGEEFGVARDDGPPDPDTPRLGDRP
ncbi:MAG: FxsA family protein [Alphaproteobacteria bacterium]|mgnify:CR=1 FL=1|nr:FxsA family protein [Alphaproteobacteria bacterium]